MPALTRRRPSARTSLLALLLVGACGGGTTTDPGDTPLPVASVEVSPDSAQVVIGSGVTYSATLRDAAGQILTGREVTWSVEDAAVASIDASTGDCLLYTSDAADE